MTTDSLGVSVDDGVATITLTRPEDRNALDRETLRALVGACARVDGDDSVRSVVLQGAGPAFCAGVDLSDLASLLRGSDDGSRGATAASEMGDIGAEAARAIEGLPQPTVVMIQGYAIGAGVVLAMACDIRVMADDAFVWIPELDLGTPLLWGGLPRLVREVGFAVAKDMVLTCRRVPAGEARQLGFTSRVVWRDVRDTIEVFVAERVPSATTSSD